MFAGVRIEPMLDRRAQGVVAKSAPLFRLPGVCAICRGWGAGRVCAACLERFAPRCARCLRCALAVPADVSICGTCLMAPPPFERASAAVDYRPPWDRLVAAFKFRGALELAGVFARATAEARRSAEEPPTLIVPVPLAPARQRERGYNQAWEIARRVGRRLAVAADPGVLVRIRETAHQLDLPPGARAANVRGAFAVEPARRADVRGRRIAVVDDVMTTATTMTEIAEVLRQAGAGAVEAWVFARTPRPGDG